MGSLFVILTSKCHNVSNLILSRVRGVNRIKNYFPGWTGTVYIISRFPVEELFDEISNTNSLISIYLMTRSSSLTTTNILGHFRAKRYIIYN